MTVTGEQPTPDLQSVDRLIESHTGLARRLAHRYVNRGEPIEDLIQVAMVGLVNAARRYDPERGSDFVRYAVPTILGELRRHFRDACWTVRVPRGLQELTLRVQATDDSMSSELGRSPTGIEIAERLDVSEEEVNAAVDAGHAYSATSLDAPVVSDDPDGPTLGDQIGNNDTATDTVEAREATNEVLAHLPERERRVLTLRFFGERTQREIADELNISQMHVSRLLARTLTRLRDHLVEDAELPQEWVEDENESRELIAHGSVR